MQPGATAVAFVFRRHPSLGPSLAKPGRSGAEHGGREPGRSARRTRRMCFLTCREVNQRSTRPVPVCLSDRATHATGKTMIDAFLREVIRIVSE